MVGANSMDNQRNQAGFQFRLRTLFILMTLAAITCLVALKVPVHVTPPSPPLAPPAPRAGDVLDLRRIYQDQSPIMLAADGSVDTTTINQETLGLFLPYWNYAATP